MYGALPTSAAEDADDVSDELIDRFGEPPASVRGITVSLQGTAIKQVYEIRKRREAALFIEDLNMDK